MSLCAYLSERKDNIDSLSENIKKKKYFSVLDNMLSKFYDGKQRVGIRFDKIQSFGGESGVTSTCLDDGI